MITAGPPHQGESAATTPSSAAGRGARRVAPTLGPRRLAAAFRAAFAGLGHLVRHEPNARIHVALALAATLLALALGLSAAEWALLVTLFGLVIGLEAMNAAVERLADLVSPEADERVKALKDLAAGAVLAGALAAAAAGGFLFLPRLARLLG